MSSENEEKINFIKHYQTSIEKSQNEPSRVLHCLKKLKSVRIDFSHLQETKIGRTVNACRKLDGEAGELANILIDKWKSLVPPHGSSESESDIKSNSKISSHNNAKKSHSSDEKKNSSSDKDKEKSSSNGNGGSNSKASSSSKHHHKHKSNEHTSSSLSMSSQNDKEKVVKSASSSSSKKRSHEEAALPPSKEKNDSKKLKTDVEKNDKSSSSKEQKSHKSSTSSSSNGHHHKHHKKDKKKEVEQTKEYDVSQGIGFAEALASFDMPKKSQKKDQLADKMVSIKSSSASKSSSKASNSRTTSDPRPSTSNEPLKPIQTLTAPPKLLTQKPKLDLLSDIANDLPNVSIPEYRPLPLNSAMKDYINTSVYGSGSMQSRHERPKNDYELLTESFSSKANRTRVYSGNAKARSEIPKLFDMCIRVLQEHIECMECTGGVPFEILRPVLEKAKPEQLQSIEYFNPYLLEDSDVLWRPHCIRKWKNRAPQEMETWREMYERCNREDDEKLNRLATSIRINQQVTSSGVQKTKMAFVDSMVKPPRNVRQKQEQFGTNRKLVVSPAARVESLRALVPNIARPGDVRLRVAAGLRDDAQQVVGRGNTQRSGMVTKKAPMMAKILSKFKR